MKILFIANDFPSRIAPTKGIFNLQLVKALAIEHQVTVIAPIPWLEELAGRRQGLRLPRERRSVREGVQVFYPHYWYPPKVLRRRYGYFYWRSIRAAVKQAIRRHRPDAVLAYWAHPDGEAAIRAGRMACAPAAVIVGGSDVLLITRNPTRRKCVENVLRRIDGVIAVNKDLAEKVAALGVDPSHIHVWQQGVDETIFHPGEQQADREKLGMNPSRRALLWVGRMVPVKGLEILVQAAAVLRDKGVQFALYLVGGGPLRSAVEADIAQRNLSDHVHLVGEQQPAQLGHWYRAADLFVMSSWSEGLPNVLRESIACGTPFVASAVGGIAEIASPLDMLFPAGDASAMASAIETALARPRMQHPTKIHSWRDSAADIIKVLQSLPMPTPVEGPVSVNQRSAPSRLRPRQLARSAASAVFPRHRFITSGPKDSGAICLTFDDGPHPTHTPAVLETLADEGVRATFFVVGRHAQRYPHLIERIVADGHTLGSHTFYHGDPRRISWRQLVDELRQTQTVLRSITNHEVTLFRPPFGKLTLGKFAALWRAQQTIVLWNKDPKDFAIHDALKRDRLLEALLLTGGDIVLLHDSLPWAHATTRSIIQRAKVMNLKFATVDQWATPSELNYHDEESLVPEALS